MVLSVAVGLPWFGAITFYRTRYTIGTAFVGRGGFVGVRYATIYHRRVPSHSVSATILHDCSKLILRGFRTQTTTGPFEAGRHDTDVHTSNVLWTTLLDCRAPGCKAVPLGVFQRSDEVEEPSHSILFGGTRSSTIW